MADKKKKSCELRQSPLLLEFTEDIEGIDEWPHSWPKGTITYRLNNKTRDITKGWHQDRAVTVALRAWQLRISDLRFRRERNPDVKVDFDISFEALTHFNNQRGVLAHAYFPGQGDISGDVHINDEWNWVTASRFQSLSRPPLVPILIHEFGHSLGLRHDTTERAAIMYPSFNLGQRKNKLHARDIERIQERYGQRRLSQRIIDYFRLRRDMAWDFR